MRQWARIPPAKAKADEASCVSSAFFVAIRYSVRSPRIYLAPAETGRALAESQTRPDYRPPITKPLALKNIFPKPCKNPKSHDSIYWKEEMFLPGAKAPHPMRTPSAQTLRERGTQRKRGGGRSGTLLQPSRKRASRRTEKTKTKTEKALKRSSVYADSSGRQAVARSLGGLAVMNREMCWRRFHRFAVAPLAHWAFLAWEG